MLKKYWCFPMKKKHYVISILFIMAVFNQSSGQSFNFKKILFEPLSSLNVRIQTINVETGDVTVVGRDTRSPSIPFTWNWGDGLITRGLFPQDHQYVDLTKNYVLRVVSHYSASETDSVELLVRFVASNLNKISLPESKRVFIHRFHGISLQQNAGFSLWCSLWYSSKLKIF